MLAEKVVKGGTGVWGDVAMPPNAVVTIADAEQMVKYILLLKNK
jgi:cytochrome c